MFDLLLFVMIRYGVMMVARRIEVGLSVVDLLVLVGDIERREENYVCDCSWIYCCFIEIEKVRLFYYTSDKTLFRT